MKVFHLLGFPKELVSGSSTFVTRLNLFCVCFLDGSRFLGNQQKYSVTLLDHLAEAVFY